MSDDADGLIDPATGYSSGMKNEESARIERCRQAIRDVFGTPDDEVGATLFVNHHLDELDASYWSANLGETAPTSAAVIDALVPSPLRYEEGSAGYSVDFSLPGKVTNYMVSVRVDAHDTAEVTMES